MRPGVPLAARQAVPQAGLALRGDEIVFEAVESLGGGSLLRIGSELAGPNERAIASAEAAQAARSASSFLVSAIALAGLSPLGQTLAQFMIV